MLMETITLVRKRLQSDCTIGYINVDGTSYATLEDTVRDVKIAEETAIPAGTYELKLRNKGGMTKHYAKKFPDMHKGMIWLQDVPGFTWVYIHIGNFADDTEGCILVGTRAKQSMIERSTQAYKKIYPKIVKMIEEKGCQIIIKDDSDIQRSD